MRKAAKQIIFCAVGLIVFCVVCRLTFFRGYTAYIPLLPREEEQARKAGVQIVVEQQGVLRHGEAEIHSGYLRVPIQPEQAGETTLYFQDQNGENLGIEPLRVSRFHTVYDVSTGGFTGDTAVLIAVTLFWLLVSAIMLWHFSQAKGTSFYAYSTIHYAGFSMFALVSGLVMLNTTVLHIAEPAQFNMLAAYSAINSASSRFMMLTTPLVLVFAVGMAVSNFALLRNARPYMNNMLGLLVCVLLVAGEAVGWYLFTRDFSGSEFQVRIWGTLENTYATIFVYFECMLAGSIVCGVKAAKHRPAPDKDFIIILGCWFRKDGTLPPLLKGRVDEAIAFWRRQKEETGREARFIPSGGQGKDEPMPEAQAMRAYLLSQDIPERLILPEDQSRSTFQNMAFSKKIIQNVAPEGKAAFATTNYHVFRSGVWALRAGLPAEGMGSKTKWWFWPNAFMRETAGLLITRWRQELFFLVIVLVFFGVLSMVVG